MREMRHNVVTHVAQKKESAGHLVEMYACHIDG